MNQEQMKTLAGWFQSQNTPSRKHVYAILITRHTFKNPLTSDGFCTAAVYLDSGEFQPWSFNGLEDMITWLTAALTYGFGKGEPEWIMNRLWEEIEAHEERTAERGYRYP